MSTNLDLDALDWMESAALELRAEPLAGPSTTEQEVIRTYVHQVQPKLIDDKFRFFTYSPKEPIILAIKKYDPDLKQHVYQWEPHRIDVENGEHFDPHGTFYCDVPPRNKEKLRPVVRAKRISHDFLIFGDQHSDSDPVFSDGATQEVHPTRADALGSLRSEARIGIKKQYNPTFKELDRAAANLLALLYNAIRVNIYDDPRDLSNKLTDVTSSWNLQYLIGQNRAAYWQNSSAEDLRISTNDFVQAEGTGSTTRFSRELIHFKDEFKDLHLKKRFHYADETQEPNLTKHASKAVELLVPLFELTHPSSSVVSSLLYNPEGKITRTGKNLREYHRTVRALLRYFGNDARDNTLITDYRNTWGEFEAQLRQLNIEQFIAAGSWKPLYQRGKTLTITVSDLETALDAAATLGYEKTIGPIPLGPGRFARFKDNEDYHVGLWTPHQK